jgi:hypothetical protein
VSFIPGKVILVDNEVVVVIQLPEASVQYVEMLIAEVVAYLIYILFFIKKAERLNQI